MATPDGVCADESCALRGAHLDVSPRFLKPVGHEVRTTRHASLEGLAQGGHVLVSQLGQHFLVSEERRVADDGISIRPLGFRAVRIEEGVSIGHLIKLLQDWVLLNVPALSELPLNLPNPNGYPCQFGGVGVQFNAHYNLRTYLWEGARQPEHFGIEDDSVLQVLEAQQGEVQEVPRAAGRVEDPEVSQPPQEGLVETFGLTHGLGNACLGLGGVGLC
ncbi:hypothetical protein D3C86_1586230 [compost metagenome]